MKIKIDTNVIVSTLKSSRGAYYKMLSLLPNDVFSTDISVPLILEYEHVLNRVELPSVITDEDIETLIDYLCEISLQQDIYFF